MSGTDVSAQPVVDPTSPTRRDLSARRKWTFRLISLIGIPLLFLISLETILRALGIGFQTTFFLPTEIAQRPVYVENLDFGRPFFPAGLERAPLPLVVGAEKPPNTCRIFVFGESAAMGFPGNSFSFGRILEVMLQHRFPNRDFELANTSMTAISSHVILPIARESADLQPDLYVVYMGNNEVVGPFGASGVLGPQATNLTLLRAGIAVRRTHIGQGIQSLIQSTSRHENKTPDWNGMTMFMEHQVRADEPCLKTVYSHFSQNLESICEAGQHAGAEIVVCTVATNLKDSPPFGSLTSLELSGEDAQEWDVLVKKGIEFETELNYDAAIASYRQAVRIDDQHAELQFRLARCLLAINQVTDAQKHYRLARDRDTLRFRADSAINSAIRMVVAKHESEGVCLADSEHEIEVASINSLPGNEYFYEHVHLNFSGNYLVARTVFRQIEKLLSNGEDHVAGVIHELLSEQECKNRLAYTAWNEMNSLGAVALLFANPPFTTQIDNDEQQSRVKQQIEAIEKQLTMDGPQVSVNAYLRALDRSDADPVLHMDYGLLLMSLGQYPEATHQFSALRRYLPYHPAPCVLLAQAFAAQGQRSNALHYCAEALRLRPSWPQALELQKSIRSAAPDSDEAGI